MPLHHDEELGNEGARVYVDTETRMLTINVALNADGRLLYRNLILLLSFLASRTLQL